MVGWGGRRGGSRRWAARCPTGYQRIAVLSRAAPAPPYHVIGRPWRGVASRGAAGRGAAVIEWRGTVSHSWSD